ncbi:MAG: DUF262 domain-containing protein [bacterium]|nr:DUF262 domain-containing protein [bacterium]
MRATLFKEVGYSLSKLIQDIEMGEIGLPDIQRPFVWKNTKVRDLFDSMYRGFPVGYLLFWANITPHDTRQIGINNKQKVPRLLIVDGQQRLTSLYAVLKGIPVVRENYSTEPILIAFRPKDQTFAVTDAAIWKDPEYIPDISALWQTSRNRFENSFFERLRNARHVEDYEEDHISEAIDRLYDLQTYPFTVLELSATVSEQEVADVFVRINSTGTPLKQADFILTLMSVFWDIGRTQLEAFCRDARLPQTNGTSPFNYVIQPDPDQILRVSIGLGFRRARLQNVYNILRGKDLETEHFSDDKREKQFSILQKAQDYVLDLQNWHEFLKCILRAGYLGAEMIPSQLTLLYTQVLFLIGKRDFHVEGYQLRNVIARWFFMSALTSRYVGSFESVMEQDMAQLRNLKSADEFVNALDQVIQDTLTESYWSITLPNQELAVSSPRSPSMFAYYAALTLLDAKALFSQLKVHTLLDPAIRAKKSAVERHHLFPKSYLAKHNITEKRDVNQIANFALVEWSDNIGISDKSPAHYYPQYAMRYGTLELADMHYWHALPENWHEMDYETFLAERRKLIASVIRDGFATLYK